MGSLEEGYLIPDIRAWCHPEPSYLCGGGIREVVSIEIRGCEDGELCRPEEELLEHRIGEPILDHDLPLASFGPLADPLLGALLGRALIPPSGAGPPGALPEIALAERGYRGRS